MNWINLKIFPKKLHKIRIFEFCRLFIDKDKKIMKENKKHNYTEWLFIVILILCTIAQAVQIGGLQRQMETQIEINKEMVMNL